MNRLKSLAPGRIFANDNCSREYWLGTDWHALLFKAKSAARHPGRILTNCYKLYQWVSSFDLENELIAAFTGPKSPSHLAIMKMARLHYGPEVAVPASLRAAADFKQRLHYARERLFYKRFRRDLGACPIGFKDLLIQCSSDSVLESTVYLEGFYDELPVLQTYESRLQVNGCAIDVGANVGVHSMALARLVGEGGTVYAFEPVRAAAERLQFNLRLNDIKNVIVREMALGDFEGDIPFYDASDQINHGLARYDPNGKLRVPVGRLDSLLQDRGKRVQLIKIDVEGMELDVIRGAAAILAKDRPALVVEYNDPPWSLEEFVKAIPFDTGLYRIPNSFREDLQVIDVQTRLSGFNNLLILPRDRP